MRHFLVAMPADVGEQAIARLDQPGAAGNVSDRADKPGDLLGRGAGREVVPADISALGDHQHVQRGLRIDVVEGQRPFVFVDGLVGDLPAQDAGENVLVVIGLGGVDRHY